MACSAYYTDPDEVAEFFCRGEGYGATSEPTADDMWRYIRKGAARINMALSASAQCACTWNTYADEFLQELNIIAAALLIFCPDCSRRFSAEEKEFYNGWLGEQLELLRTGKLELCAGETAVDYPALGIIQYGLTDRNVVQMIYNYEIAQGS
jgi:hypothetical protein